MVAQIPGAVREWVDAIAADWNFRQIIPCHFAGPIACSPREFRKAYDWLEAESREYVSGSEGTAPKAAPEQTSRLPAWLPSLGRGKSAAKDSGYFTFPEADMKLLNGLNEILLRVGVFNAPRR